MSLEINSKAVGNSINRITFRSRYFNFPMPHAQSPIPLLLTKNHEIQPVTQFLNRKEYISQRVNSNDNIAKISPS